MKNPTSSMSPRTPRPAIADLLKVAKVYKLNEGATLDHPVFSLVNEIPLVGKGDTLKVGHDYTRDELIKMIGLAYVEFADMVKEFDEVKKQAVEDSMLAERVYALAVKKGAENTDNWVSLLESAMSRLHQAYDVLKEIALNTPADRAKEVAQRWYKRIEPGEKANIIQKSPFKLIIHDKPLDGGIQPGGSTN